MYAKSGNFFSFDTSIRSVLDTCLHTFFKNHKLLWSERMLCFYHFARKVFYIQRNFVILAKQKINTQKIFILEIFFTKIISLFLDIFFVFFTLKTLLLVVWQGCMTITGTLTSAINCVYPYQTITQIVRKCISIIEKQNEAHEL